MDSFSIKNTMTVNGQTYTYYDLNKLGQQFPSVNKLPYSLRVLLENLLRHEDGKTVTAEHIKSMIDWKADDLPSKEISFVPARVILQDFTGVPAIVDLAAMRQAMSSIGGDSKKINPLNPVELVIDHSVMVDSFGHPMAINENVDLDYQRNKERYEFLKWGQQAFDNFKVVPPNTGIVHQVNLEYLARVVFEKNDGDSSTLYPDTLVGTDSHTTMINGLGVLGWGVGGIEAEAAMLGQPISMLIPQVIGFNITGKLLEGITSTDLVLVVVQKLREKGVVGKFVEFFGEGLKNLTLADRATIANMAPEYGATCGFFPADDQTLAFMMLTGRSEEKCMMIEEYCLKQNLYYDGQGDNPQYTDVISLDLSEVKPCISGPKRPQDKIDLVDAKDAFSQTVRSLAQEKKVKLVSIQDFDIDGKHATLTHGFVAIAAITSCTNTSNPAVMIAAGLLAKKAYDKGLRVKPWVKTSLAPGSQVVTEYLKKTQLLDYLEHMGFHTVGYGCTTCIGNSGPLSDDVAKVIKDGRLAAVAVLSGNRNFEGRIHPDIRASYLASPPLVVAYAIAGSMAMDIVNEPLGEDQNGNKVYLKDIWPTNTEIQALESKALSHHVFKAKYSDVFKGDERWAEIEVHGQDKYEWVDKSTYVKEPPYFKKFKLDVTVKKDIKNARCLAVLGDSITTDHISPAGSISAQSPAGDYLLHKGVKREDFNSYGSRRGNHEVMMRGTFANVRLRNLMAKNTEGGWTVHHPSGRMTTIFDASNKYRFEKVPLVILAGKEYGTGSSRDWAAKGTKLLGVKAVIAQSFERIHRSNLIGMGVLPLEFTEGQSHESLSLDGSETYDIPLSQVAPRENLNIKVTRSNGESFNLVVKVRIDTPKELDYFSHDGILPYVIRSLYNS